jgi:hypothetical protein
VTQISIRISTIPTTTTTILILTQDQEIAIICCRIGRKLIFIPKVNNSNKQDTLLLWLLQLFLNELLMIKSFSKFWEIQQ